MSGRCPVSLRRGALSFSREEHLTFLSGAEAVVLLREGDDLLIFPIRAAHAGGYLLKQVNLAGDRSAHVAGFLRDQGFPDETELLVSAAWSAERAALVIPCFFSLHIKYA